MGGFGGVCGREEFFGIVRGSCMVLAFMGWESLGMGGGEGIGGGDV